ncbi:MAG: 3'(2'),5'-bisphosphate nucleotidase CysQ [Bacteroidia bacterium]|nr:3'(2'),5'-bisphosphate nucleotidase CysQ [Bacteroidia bacterium]
MNKELLISAIKTSVLAGEKILEIYNTAFAVELKEDHSPLTAADKAAHELISTELLKWVFPILSEEGKTIPYEVRKDWKNYWMVDPLDGTKEFVKRNGEFTVNIAFMDKDTPVFGVIYCPVSGIICAGFNETVYSLNKDQVGKLSVNNLEDFELKVPADPDPNEIKVVASRSHLSPETENFISMLNLNGEKISMVNAGSALKFCLLAEGKATVYPRFAPTMEWDTAAGHAILKACGKNIILHPSNIEMKYNKPSLVNDWFIAR